jgi:hypothetical protein
MRKNKNIFRVYHIRIIAKKNWFTRHETDRFLNNLCQKCVRTYLSIHDCLSFRIICCQIFCDLLLKSAFKRIFNVMQLILVKIKWHIKWKYLIQKFQDIFFNNHCQQCLCAYLGIHDCLSFLHEVIIGNHRTKTFLREVMIGNHRNKTTES